MVMYEGKSGDVLGTFNASPDASSHTGSILSIAFNASGTHACTVSADKTLRLWDMATRSCSAVYSCGTTVGRQKVGVAWTDNDTIVSLGVDGTLSYFDSTLAMQRHVHGHKCGVTSIGMIPSTGTIVSSSYDGRVLLWSAHTPAPLAGAAGEEGERPVVDVTCTNTYTVIAWADSRLEILDNINGQPPITLDKGKRVHLPSSPKTAHMSEGSPIVVVCDDNVWVIDPETGKQASYGMSRMSTTEPFSSVV